MPNDDQISGCLVTRGRGVVEEQLRAVRVQTTRCQCVFDTKVALQRTQGWSDALHGHPVLADGREREALRQPDEWNRELPMTGAKVAQDRFARTSGALSRRRM